MAIGMAGWFVIVGGVWVYEEVQSFRAKKGSFNHMQQQQKLKELVAGMGTKTESLLKVAMCRELYATRAKQPVGVCVKQKCQKERQILKEKSDNITRFVDSTINFEWCSQCKNKKPFDEFLTFRPH